MQNFKSSITKIPTYLDGMFRLFEIKQTTDHFPIEYLKNTEKDVFFEELSISDRLRFEAEQREKELTMMMI